MDLVNDDPFAGRHHDEGLGNAGKNLFGIPQ
jgi:hypothetical protein